MSLEAPEPDLDVGETPDGDLDYDELADLLGEHVQHLADRIDEEELVMRYDWAESPVEP